MDAKKTPEQVFAEAQDLLDEIERSLDESRRAYREMGLDYDKVLKDMDAQAGPNERAQAQELLQRDLDEVRLAVDQAKSSVAVSQVSSVSSVGRVKRQRSMV